MDSDKTSEEDKYAGRTYPHTKIFGVGVNSDTSRRIVGMSSLKEVIL